MAKTTRFSKPLVTLLIIVIIIAGILIVKTYFAPARLDQQRIALARFKGDAKAPVKIVEFIDFQCPACAVGAQYLKKLMAEHPNLIRLEMKYYPLTMHKHAFLSARYAQCAAQQDKFWPFQDLLIERQAQWQGLIDAKPSFELIASEIKLNKSQLENCLKDEKVEAIIFKEKAEGTALGVKSTPSYFLNGTMLVGSKSLELEIDKYLNGK